MFKFLQFLFSRFGRESRKSRKFGPRENFPLYGRMNGRVVPCSTSGPKTSSSPEEETELVKFLLRCAAIGDPKSHVTRNHGILDYLLSVRNNHIMVLIDNAQELAKVEFDMVRSVRHFINTSPRATCLAFSQDP